MLIRWFRLWLLDGWQEWQEDRIRRAEAQIRHEEQMIHDATSCIDYIACRRNDIMHGRPEGI